MLGEAMDFGMSEAYNLLRTNLSFFFPDKKGGKVIGVTSPCPQEGKSYTSINLAYSLAKNGQKVLLIDCDMRRPSLAASLQLDMAPGLSNRLVGQTDGSLHEHVLHENLSVILSGDIPPNPSELIGSAEMGTFLSEMAAQYDYVLVDLPPVTAVSDPLIISKHLDGVVLILKHNYSKRSDVLETVRKLRFTKVHILGFVYNGYRSGHGYYRYKKGYYHTSDYATKEPSENK